MTLEDSLTVAFRALLNNRLRSLLTTLGIVIGVGSIIALLAVASGAEKSVASEIQSLGARVIFVSPGSARSFGRHRGMGTAESLSLRDSDAIARNLPSVEITAPSRQTMGGIVAGNANWASTLYGVTPEYFIVHDWLLQSGRLLYEDDVRGARKVVILGAQVAEELFGLSNPVGQSVRVNKVPMTVIGVLAERGQGGFGPSYDDSVFVPLTTAQQRLMGGSRRDSVSRISVRVRPGQDMSATVEEIRALLRQRKNVEAGEDEPFTVTNTADILAASQEITGIFTVVLGAIGSISLLVGGIGIMNIMLVSVTERTREIGLRKAVGARPKDILLQFLTEAVALCVIGGGIGVLLGWGVASLVNALTPVPSHVGLDSILIAFGFSAGVGVFFGYYPARQAARLNPIDALRFE